MKNDLRSILGLATVAVAGGLISTANAQQPLPILETFEGFAPGAAPGGGYTYGTVANNSRQVVAGVGVGGGQALVIASDFLAGSGMAWQFQRGTVTGNNSLNLSDYTFQFDGKGNEASRSIRLQFQTWPNDNFGGTGPQSAADVTINLPATANTFQHYSINLGTVGTIDPTANTFQVAFVMDSGNWGADAGNQFTVDNVQLSQVPEPSVTVLASLGLFGGLWLLGRRK